MLRGYDRKAFSRYCAPNTDPDQTGFNRFRPAESGSKRSSVTVAYLNGL